MTTSLVLQIGICTYTCCTCWCTQRILSATCTSAFKRTCLGSTWWLLTTLYCVVCLGWVSTSSSIVWFVWRKLYHRHVPCRVQPLASRIECHACIWIRANGMATVTSPKLSVLRPQWGEGVHLPQCETRVVTAERMDKVAKQVWPLAAFLYAWRCYFLQDIASMQLL